MANEDENQKTGTKAKYRVVTMPVAASPCRNCPETALLQQAEVSTPHVCSQRLAG